MAHAVELSKKEIEYIIWAMSPSKKEDSTVVGAVKKLMDALKFGDKVRIIRGELESLEGKKTSLLEEIKTLEAIPELKVKISRLKSELTKLREGKKSSDQIKRKLYSYIKMLESEKTHLLAENEALKAILLRLYAEKRYQQIVELYQRLSGSHQLRVKRLVAKAYCELFKIPALYYLTHWTNLKSIFERGLLCWSFMKSENIPHASIADPDIQDRRSRRSIGGRPAHDYVPLFFSTKTPMLSKIKYEGKFHQREIVYISINSEILGEEGVHFSDGNIIATATKVFDNIDDLRKLPWKTIRAPYWSGDEESRIKGAEVLIPERIDPCWFQKIVVYNQAIADHFKNNLPKSSIPIEVNSTEFYF